MKMQVESTERFWDVDGVTCREWVGTTPLGAKVKFLVASILVNEDEPTIELCMELGPRPRLTTSAGGRK